MLWTAPHLPPVVVISVVLLLVYRLCFSELAVLSIAWKNPLSAEAVSVSYVLRLPIRWWLSLAPKNPLPAAAMVYPHLLGPSWWLEMLSLIRSRSKRSTTTG